MTSSDLWLVPQSEPGVRPLPLILGALLLAATAAFHVMELGTAQRWLVGTPERVLSLLWLTPALSWLIIAAFWLYHAATGSAPSTASLVMTALLPLVVAVPLLVRVSPTHPAGYMLIGASVLALRSRKKAA